MQIYKLEVLLLITQNHQPGPGEHDMKGVDVPKINIYNIYNTLESHNVCTYWLQYVILQDFRVLVLGGVLMFECSILCNLSKCEYILLDDMRASELNGDSHGVSKKDAAGGNHM